MAKRTKQGRFRRELERREPEIIKALFDAVKSKDERIRLEAVRLTLAYLHGRPGEEPLDDGADAVPTLTEAELDEAERQMERLMEERARAQERARAEAQPGRPVPS